MTKNRRIPSYQHHKATGQARVRIAGKDHYLGRYGSPESHERYDEIIAQFLETEPGTSTTLSALLAVFWAECKKRYGGKGRGTYGYAGNWRPTIRLLRIHFGDLRAEDVGPVKLRKLLEDTAEENDWSLTYVKMHLARVKQIFEWAAGEELISITAFQRLKVCKIRNGRKTKPIPPVDDELVDRTLPLLHSNISDMVQLQRLTGMRPGELVIMRPEDIDQSSDIWVYVPESHKTEHRGKTRTIYIGPKAQAILAPWLIEAEDYVFPTRRARHYTSDSYRRAVTRVCEKHGIPRWSPHQLRKAAATKIRSALDVESAASVLGHSSSVVTQQHYAAADRARAIEAAKMLG